MSRSISRRRALAIVVCVAVTQVSGAFAQTAREGLDYTTVKPVQPTTAPAGQVEVVEFFGYWCPACDVFEPSLHDWTVRNAARVKMVYVPMPTHFRAGEANLQKLYYALDAMGIEAALRPKVFAAIHVARTLPDSADAGRIADWVASQGVDRKAFVATFDSFAVQSRVTRANQIAAAWNVTGTPSLGVAGRVLVPVDAKRLSLVDRFVAQAAA
jgi:thiol:disulfide interchange protein DsbA